MDRSQTECVEESAAAPWRILALAPGTWRGPEVYGAGRYHLWTLAGWGARVLYVEPPLRLALRAREWHAHDRDFRAVSLAGVPPFAPRFAPPGWPGRSWRAMTSAATDGALAHSAALRDLRPNLLWFSAPWQGALAERLRRRFPRVPAVYLAYDDLAASPALSPARQRQLSQWEAGLCRTVDLVLATSLEIARRRSPHARQTAVIENCAAEFFLPEHAAPSPPSAAPLLRALTRIDPPRIVYGGAVDLRLDARFFRAALDHIPEASLVFLGRAAANITPALRRLLRHPRVHALGPVPYSAYPALYQHADALVLAHRHIPFTTAMYPAKLSEYLAAGRPVVSVPLPEIARVAAEAADPRTIRLAATPHEFARACAAAIVEDEPALAEARRDLVRGRRTFSAGGKAILHALAPLAPQSI